MRTMSNEEIIKVVQASMDGEKIERLYSRDRCADLDADFPQWDFSMNVYRVKELTLEEFIEEMHNTAEDGGSFNNGKNYAINKIRRYMKKLQGEDNASRD